MKTLANDETTDRMMLAIERPSFKFQVTSFGASNPFTSVIGLQPL